MKLHLLTVDTAYAKALAVRLSFEGYTSTYLDPAAFAGRPKPFHVLRARIRMMLQADAVVVCDAECPPDIEATCRATAIRLIHIDQLPLPAPDHFGPLDAVNLAPIRTTALRA